MKITSLKSAIKKQLISFDTYSEEEANRIVNESVWSQDPYDWDQNADFTISTENGLPSTTYFSDNAYKFWDNVMEDLNHDIHFEPINGGVMGGYVG